MEFQFYGISVLFVWMNKVLFSQNLLVQLFLFFVFYSRQRQCLQQLFLAVIATTLELQKFESYFPALQVPKYL